VEGGEGSPKRLYHRIESPTQPAEIALVQRQTGKLRGYPALGSIIPKVKAYDGPLPEGKRGIEFTTDVPPDDGAAPGRPTWSGPRRGIMFGVDDEGRDFVEIAVEVTKVLRA
jgi:hypothetical protein